MSKIVPMCAQVGDLAIDYLLVTPWASLGTAIPDGEICDGVSGPAVVISDQVYDRLGSQPHFFYAILAHECAHHLVRTRMRERSRGAREAITSRVAIRLLDAAAKQEEWYAQARAYLHLDIISHSKKQTANLGSSTQDRGNEVPYSKDVNRSLPTEEKIMNVSEMTVAQVAAFYEKWERAGSDCTEGDSLQSAFEAAMYTEPEMDYETEQEAYFSFTKGWLSIREGVPDINKVIIAGMRRMGFTFEYGQNHDTVTFWKFRNQRGELVHLRTDAPRD